MSKCAERVFIATMFFAVGFVVCNITNNNSHNKIESCGSDAVAEEMLRSFKKLLQNHHLLKCCRPESRELRFLEKGGEYLPDYNNPRTLNDKIGYILDNYFLKSPITSHIGNKYLAKKYVAKAIGEDHVVKLIGAWDNPEDIAWDDLPNSFVLKVVRGHFGRQVIPVKDKSKIDVAETIQKLKDFCESPEMQRIKGRRIIAEEYLEPTDGTKAITDYKFFCSFGRVFLSYCLTNSRDDTCAVDNKGFSYYSIPKWERLPITVPGHEPNDVPSPKNLNKMMELAAKLSKPFPLIRIDFYEIGNRVLVGELTEDAGGGKEVLRPVIWNFKLGEMVDVPDREELNKLIEKDKREYESDLL
ncbi:MAG: hypothetical protein LBB21_05605 [Holosporaceae bacterium]|jgi:hypothetical protein|nr:hypothetical protein [Holosporaceae bacterium]